MPGIDPFPVAFMTGGCLYVEEINLTQMLPICINPTPVFPVRALFLHPGLSLIRPSPHPHTDCTLEAEQHQTPPSHTVPRIVPNPHSTNNSSTPSYPSHDSISLCEIRRSSPTSLTDRLPSPDLVCDRAGANLSAPAIGTQGAGGKGGQRPKKTVDARLAAPLHTENSSVPAPCLSGYCRQLSGRDTHTHTHTRSATGQYDLRADRFPGPQVPPCP